MTKEIKCDESSKIVDSHCHLNILNLSRYEGDLNLALKAARSVGVAYFLNAAVNSFEDYETLNLISVTHPDVFFSVGLHPTDAIGTAFDTELFLKMAQNPKVVAIGETGLDYYRCPDDHVEQERQRQLFRVQIQLAKKVNKPLIIHQRAAEKDCLRILEEEGGRDVGGVFHCFTADSATAKSVLNLGFYLGISGIITFKKADSLTQVVTETGLDRILLETDAPFLAPEPKRGKSNEPVNLIYTAQKVACIKNVPYEELAQKTTQNFLKLFKIKV